MNKTLFHACGRATALGSVLSLVACASEVHSAQWWMGHGPELQAKLIECKNNPALQSSDNCRNATEAFVTLVSATAQQNATTPTASPATPASTQ